VTSAPDPAVAQARRVVGLYGDPDVTWSIVLALDVAEPLDRDAVELALANTCHRYPHLGRPSDVATFEVEQDLLPAFADLGYGDHDPLLRVAVSSDSRTLIVAAHHGAVDGLGLLGAASLLSGLSLTSSARGIERTAEPTSFLRAGVRRSAEAAFRPPLRLRSRSRTGSGDWLIARTVDLGRPSSAALLAASTASVRAWNAGATGRPVGRHLVVAMGLSRRAGTPTPEPDRDTAYVRLLADHITSAEEAAAVITATAPEPAFPVTDGGGLAPRVARLLAGRLGSTVLVSNLGLVRGEGLVGVRFWPVPAGPAGTAIGLATAGGTTTVTVRQRRNAFASEDAERFVDLVASELAKATQ
jgi:hypothetical protein